MSDSSTARTLLGSSLFHRLRDNFTPVRAASWILLASLLLVAPAGAADYEFEWVNPVPQGNGLYAMDFEDAQIGYAVGSKGTCMKTTDGGQTWIDQTNFPDFTKNLRDVIVMGPGNLIAVGENPGIFRSTDGGQSWSPVTNPSTAILNNIEVIAGDTLSAVGDGGEILRSTDSGSSWSLRPAPADRRIFDQFWWNGQAGYVVGLQLTRQTNDGGQTWDPIPDVPEPWTYTKIHFLDSQNGWLMQHFNTFRTTDGGASWFEKHGPFGASPFYQEEVAFIDDTHRFIVTFLEGAEIWETTDDAVSWTMIYQRVRTGGYGDIERLSDGSMVVCSAFGDLLRSTDMGHTWVNFTRSPSDEDRSTLQAMAVLPGGKAFAGGRDESWLMSVDGGDTWETPLASPGFGTTTAIAFRTDDFGLVGGSTFSLPSRVSRTTDGGASWTDYELTGGFVGGPQSISIPGDSTCYTVTYGGSPDNHVFRSDDGGQTWGEITNEISVDGRLESVFFVDVDTGFVAGGTTASGGDAQLWKTVNGGASWTPVSVTAVGSIIGDMHWMNSSTGVVVNSDGAYRTNDGGASWTEVISEAIGPVDFCDALHGVAGHYYYDWVWVTSDGGVTWEKVEYPWENSPEDVVAVPDGFLVCGGGTTILRGREPGPTGVINDMPSPRSSPLTVAPNPFNPTTSIRFTVPEAGHISLAVYDVSGRRVSVLASEYYRAGVFDITWDGRDDSGQTVASGVYFLVLEGDDFNATGKMVLLK
jgi:photosystem II stability/assembly factor-like uncharacterized protein